LPESKAELLEGLVIEAAELKKHRTSVDIYSCKCADIIERIHSALIGEDLKTLSEKHLISIKKIKEILSIEEQFATASADNRTPNSWKDFLND
jgi:hypothetical protein